MTRSERRLVGRGTELIAGEVWFGFCRAVNSPHIVEVGVERTSHRSVKKSSSASVNPHFRNVKGLFLRHVVKRDRSELGNKPYSVCDDPVEV